MLTAFDKTSDSRLALPDYRSRPELEIIRKRAHNEELLCPVCRQLLWLHVGQIRIPHFAHRRLNDCPHTHVSESILCARTLLYRYFHERIQTGQIQGTVELEPNLPELPIRTHVDVLLKQSECSPVAVVLLESSLNLDSRILLRRSLEAREFVFRPVFLSSRLKQPAPTTYFLDTTQREYLQRSPYGVKGDSESAPTLRFIDPDTEQWLSLRCVRLFEKPQAYHADRRFSSVNQLIWSQLHSEWIHPGESEALALHQQQLAALRETRSQTRHANSVAEREPPPKWLEGLVCIGCNIRTTRWQNALPGDDICVCSDCFNRGVRLPG